MWRGHHGWCCYFESYGLFVLWIFGLEDVGGYAVFPVIRIDVAADLSAVVWLIRVRFICMLDIFGRFGLDGGEEATN